MTNVEITKTMTCCVTSDRVELLAEFDSQFDFNAIEISDSVLRPGDMTAIMLRATEVQEVIIEGDDLIQTLAEASDTVWTNKEYSLLSLRKAFGYQLDIQFDWKRIVKHIEWCIHHDNYPNTLGVANLDGAYILVIENSKHSFLLRAFAGGDQ